MSHLSLLENRNTSQVKSGEFLNAIFENLDYGITACDSLGRIIIANKPIRKLWGTLNDNIALEQWAKQNTLYHSDKKTPMKLNEIPLYRALHGEQIQNEKLVIILPNQMPQTFSVSGQPTFDLNGKKLGAFTTMDKINERDAEGENNEYQHLLRELKNQKALREQFVSTLAHDLRTPLSIVKSYAELILRSLSRSDPNNLFSERIVQTVNRMDSMIHDLLDVSQIEAGHLPPLKIDECDLNLFFSYLAEELVTLYGDRFVISVNEPIRGYWSNDGLHRCLENLCNNAIKYGDSTQPIKILASLKNQTISIAVINRGHPISEEDIPKLFDPYHRCSASHQKPRNGWGIGLTLVRGMIEAMGGSVQVQSSYDAGTIFTLFFPQDCR